jgi:hypothetical protein
MSNKPVIDLWANFLMNEKLVTQHMDTDDVLAIIKLCEVLATKRGPKIRPYNLRLESRKLVCETAMELGIDLTAIRYHGKVMMARGLLDAWNKAYAERYGSAVGTASKMEASRRDVKTRLAERRKQEAYQEKLINCTCGNPQHGFPCMCDWMKKYPGNNQYSCPYCGIYQAEIPRCMQCERTVRHGEDKGS